MTPWLLIEKIVSAMDKNASQDRFQTIEDVAVTPAPLPLPDFSHHLWDDASNFAIGSPQHVNDTTCYCLCSHSGDLQQSRNKFCTEECLACVWSIGYFRPYYGKRYFGY